MLNHPNMNRQRRSVLDRLVKNTGVDVRRLMAKEGASWRERIEHTSQRASTPLRFAQALGDDMPLPLEVVRNDRRLVVVHIFRRPDIAPEKAEPVVAAAISDVFGKPTESMRDPKTGELTNVFYRDEEAIRIAQGLKRKVLPTDSWYLEFPESMSLILPDVDTLRDKLVTAVKARWLSAP